MFVSSPRPRIPWATVPLLLPVLALGGGIALAAHLEYRYAWMFLGATGGLGLLATSLHLRPRPAAVLLWLALFTLGSWYAGVRHPLHDGAHFSHHYTKGDQLLVEVQSVREGERRQNVEADVTALLRDGERLPTSGKLVAYVAGDTLRTGDRLLLASAVDTVPGPLNPHAFDYAGYLADKNIFHRSFVDSTEWLRVGTASGFSLRAFGERAREAWFASLQPYLAGDDLAVAAALIMGKKDLLGAEVKSAYADTGAIHVLAVSGLHVGILALIVMQLLRLLVPPRPFWLALRTGLTILLVWYFALVTGLSASVQRAALMVTVVLIGKQLNRNNNIFNLLAIAALVMLLVEPKQLFQVGFQLSFAAVAGIALFTRRLQRLVYLPGKLSVLWDAIAVSTAAQLGTLPLSLYYFGQFPLYFMLSGTLVIVFAYLVLGLGLLHGLLALVGVSGAGLWPTSTLLEGVVSVQNAFIFYCRQLPSATLQLADFTWLSAVGLYLLISCLAYLAFRPSHRGRWAAMGVAGLLVAYWTLGPVWSPAPPQFTIYDLPRATLIDVYDGRRGVAVGDSVAQDDLDFNVLPARQALGVAFGTPLPLDQDTSLAAVTVHSPLLRLLDRRVLVLDGTRDWRGVAQLPEVDLVLVRSGVRPDRVPELPPGVPVVVDGSNAPYVGRLWRERYGGVHVTGVDGAYRVVE
ncbi:ComEC/Rec2 family competence protein [Neolewinella sp.]|uniref:ComEC/Rec2 family competence protein n=1 Tax=Neolewinella sp. TaxID=2993543 RepID=UPI003B5217DE